MGDKIELVLNVLLPLVGASVVKLDLGAWRRRRVIWIEDYPIKFVA